MQYKGDIKAGETILVTAAAGGTGHFAVQIAKNKGCRLIATCGSKDKAEKLKGLGLDRVISYKDEVLISGVSRSIPADLIQNQRKEERQWNGSHLQEYSLAALADKPSE